MMVVLLLGLSPFRLCQLLASAEKASREEAPSGMTHKQLEMQMTTVCITKLHSPFATSFDSSEDQVLVARILSLGTQLAYTSTWDKTGESRARGAVVTRNHRRAKKYV